MVLKQLYIQNFMSIKQVTLNLSDRGMTLILGENQDNQDFDNNGAGKSTITEALTYVLYGKTLRGLKGDDIVNKTSKRNCKVMLDIIDDDGTEYRFARYRKHKDNGNKFFLFRNDKDITPKSETDFTQVITNILNMDFLTFTSSILYSAQSFKFTTATDAEMKNAFDTMLGLDFYSRCLEEVKEQLKQLNNQQQLLNTDLSNFRQQKEGLNTHLNEYLELQSTYEEEKEEELDDLAAELDEKKKKLLHTSDKVVSILEDLQAARQDAEKKEKLWKAAEKKLADVYEIRDGIDGCKDELRENQTLENKVNLLINTAQSKCDNNQQHIKKCDTRIEFIREKIKDSSDTIGTPCPVCGNKITKSSVASVISQYEDEIQQYEGEKATYQKAVEESEKKIQKYKEQLEELQKVNEEIEKDKQLLEKALEASADVSKQERHARAEYDEANSTSMTLNVNYNNLQAEEDRLSTEITNLEKSMKKKQEESNPYTQLIENTQRSICDIDTRVGKVEESLLLLEKDEEVLQFWQQGFSNSGIKSLLLDDITPFLNRRVNKYLRKLSSDHMEVMFSTQSTLKSGDKREKFNIEVTNSDGGDNYTSNSSGEKRRIDIAVNLALQDLIASRSNKKLNIAFFDEVFDTLDSVGVEKVVDLLQDMAKEKSSLFVITHNNDLKSLFTNSIKIVKKGGYSTLVEE